MESRIESLDDSRYPKLRFSDNPYDKFSTLELTFDGLDPLYYLRNIIEGIIEECKTTKPDSGT